MCKQPEWSAGEGIAAGAWRKYAFNFKTKGERGGRKKKDLRWFDAALTVHAGQYANMLLDINGKMVRGMAFAALLLCVVCVFCFNTGRSLLCAGLCYGRMCRTYETDSGANSGESRTHSCRQELLSVTLSSPKLMFLSMNFSALCYACVAQSAFLFL